MIPFVKRCEKQFTGLQNYIARSCDAREYYLDSRGEGGIEKKNHHPSYAILPARNSALRKLRLFDASYISYRWP